MARRPGQRDHINDKLNAALRKYGVQYNPHKPRAMNSGKKAVRIMLKAIEEQVDNHNF